jgi:hypothetical protein
LPAILAYHAAYAQWEPTSGIEGGIVHNVGVCDRSVFAGTYYGVFVSTSNGYSWKQIGPPSSRTFNAITSHDSVIYATGGKYLYRFNEMDIVMHKVIGNGESGTVRRTPSEGAENEIGDTSE